MTRIKSKLISLYYNKKGLSPFYQKKIFLIKGECRTPYGVRSNSDLTTKKIMHKFKIDLVLFMKTCIFLLLKSTLGRRLGTGFTDL